MMLCMHCYREIQVAYNELCFHCYKTIGRMPAKAAKTQAGEIRVARLA